MKKLITLLTLLIMTNAYSYIKVSYTNLKDSGSVVFPTQEEADKFIDFHIKNKSWGEVGDYTITQTDVTAEVEARETAREDLIEERKQIKRILDNFEVPTTQATRDAWIVKVTRILKRLVRDSKD